MSDQSFTPDYRHFEDVVNNRRPARLPVYEHIIGTEMMEKVLDRQFAGLLGGTAADIEEFFRTQAEFFRLQTYDTVSYEVCIGGFLPGHGAISGGMAGPIQSRGDFEKYPWGEVSAKFWEYAGPRFDTLVRTLPSGMRAVGGIGNGVFEISEDLVGLEYLPLMQVDDPQLYGELFDRIGDLMAEIWAEFLPRYGEHFVACRVGDDLGFRSSLLTNPVTVREHIVPQYKRVIDLVHGAGREFVWHSCGCIFEIMDDFIDIGIDAKHSNEDAISPYDTWIERYGDRIGLLGGFDMDFLCSSDPDTVFERVVEDGQRFRASAKGYALGSGNSIPDYVPMENYLAMIRGAQRIRELESS